MKRRRRPQVGVLERIDSSGLTILAASADVVTLYGLPRGEMLRQSADLDAVLVKSTVVVDADLLDAMPRLRVVGRAGTGTDNIDLVQLSKRGIHLVSTPGANADSAADFAIGLILALIRNIPLAITRTRMHDYRRHILEGREMGSLAVGVVGLGNVGMGVASRLMPFGCKVLGFDRNASRAKVFSERGGICVDGLLELAGVVDVVTLHVPLTADTRGIIGKKFWDAADTEIYLVNTARGGLVDEVALRRALESGRVKGAALDVLEPEPAFEEEPETTAYRHPYTDFEQVLVTPHLAASTLEAQTRISEHLVDAVLSALDAAEGAS